MNPLLKEIRVAEGQIIELLHPVTGAVIKTFQATEQIVEKDWNLVEGFLEANFANNIIITQMVPQVQARAVPTAS